MQRKSLVAAMVLPLHTGREVILSEGHSGGGDGDGGDCTAHREDNRGLQRVELKRFVFQSYKPLGSNSPFLLWQLAQFKKKTKTKLVTTLDQTKLIFLVFLCSLYKKVQPTLRQRKLVITRLLRARNAHLTRRSSSKRRERKAKCS